MKFCRDCKHHDPIGGIQTPVIPACLKSEAVDMVTGESTYRSCQETRENPALCGKDASWFEPKKANGPAE